MIKAVDMEYIADRTTIFLIRIYKLKFLGCKYFANKTNNVINLLHLMWLMTSENNSLKSCCVCIRLNLFVLNLT